MPVFAEYRRQRGDAETSAGRARRHAARDRAARGVGDRHVLAAPWLVTLLASGFKDTPGKVDLTAQMIRIVFPYIFFVSLVSLAGGVLNVYRRFAIPAFTPVLLNLSIIGAALFLAPYCDPPITALAWGVLIGGAAQLALQIRPLVAIGMFPRPRFDWRDEGVRRVLLAMGPAVIGVSAAQISALINAQRRLAGGMAAFRWITMPTVMEFECAARRGARHGPPAVAREASRRRIAGTRRSRLGPAARVSARAAGGGRAWVLATPMMPLYQYGSSR